MSSRTDEEFEAIIHEADPAPAPTVESDDAKHLRADLEPAHAVEEEAPETRG
ncbi:MAG: hypothetical protein QOH69_985 [Actinomycetota bacterium]|jgi:hypothetical protein|nr:hypothetical protein [Actinomycetota bacterium]